MRRSKQQTEPVEELPGQERIDMTEESQSPEPGQDVSTLDTPVSGEIMQQIPAITSLFTWLGEQATRTDQDDWQAMEASVRRILEGADAATILQEDTPISGKTFLDQPFRLDGFTITESDFQEGAPFYANLDAYLGPKHGRRVINVGGLKVLAKLWVLHNEGNWPYYVRLKGNETKQGYTVLDLVQAN